MTTKYELLEEVASVKEAQKGDIITDTIVGIKARVGRNGEPIPVYETQYDEEVYEEDICTIAEAKKIAKEALLKKLEAL